MKKIFSFLCMSVLAVGIAGCDLFGKKEELTFAEYLEQTETYSTAKLDSDVGPINLSILDQQSFLTALDVTNTKASIQMGPGATINAYAWAKTESDNKMLYFAGPFGEQGEDAIGKVNLDLIDETIADMRDSMIPTEYQAMIEAITADTNESSALEASELINNALTIFGLDETYDVDEMLAKINFSIEDFEDEGDGVYKLKLTALVNMVEEIVGQELPVDPEILAALEEALAIKVKFAESHINEIVVTMNTIDVYPDAGTQTTNITISVAFEYVDNKVSTVTIDETTYTVFAYEAELDIPNDATYLNVKTTMGNGAFSYELKEGTSATDINTQASLSLGQNNGKTTFAIAAEIEGETGDTMEVEASIELIGNWISAATITAPYGDGTVTLTVESNVNVTIPADYVALEADAYDFTGDLFEMLGQLMQPTDPDIDIIG